MTEEMRHTESNEDRVGSSDAQQEPEVVHVESAGSQRVNDPSIAQTDAVPGRDFERELSESHDRITSLTNELESLQQSGRLTEESLHRLSVALSEEVKRRSEIQAAFEAYKQQVTAELAQASQATQVLASEKQDLEVRAANAEAKATKLEVLVAEFPDLLGYADLIPASTDPAVVRAACQRLQEARTRDLETVRAQAITGRMYQVGASPARQEVTLADPQSLGKWLREAMDNPAEFQRREALIQQQLQAASRRI